MKNKIREEIKEKRKIMNPEEVREKSSLAQKMFLEWDRYKKAKTVMLYMPLGNEVNTLEIINDALLKEKNVLVPVTDRETFEISAYKITDNTEFEKGAFLINEPKEKIPYDSSKIDLVLVPGITFDRAGGRIGFGKGCYDKFLKDTKAIKVGFCYDFQVIEHFETSKTDINMDYIVTEKEIIRGKL